MMPKVLVVATSRKTRGGITSVVKAHETGEQWKKYHCRWIETHRDGPTWRKILYLVRALTEYIILLPFYDIVHIHVATTPSAKRKCLFFYPAKWSGKKVLFHFHPSNESFLYKPHNQKLYRKLFSQANLVLVLSEQWRKWIKESLGLTDRIHVQYNPCPIVNRRNNIKKKYILFAGTIIPRKGYEILLKGFANIAQKYPEWEIVFAGNGDIERGKHIAKKLNIEKQVSFLGWVSGKDKEKVFQEASIYCLASDGEGFPMGILDAWAYGIPCVMTPVGGIPDIVEDGKNGLIFPVGRADILSCKLEQLIVNKDLRNNIVIYSNQWVYGKLNINTINRQIGNWYNLIWNIKD